MNGYRLFLALFTWQSLLTGLLFAVEALRPFRTDTPPQIDGVIDEPLWQHVVIDTPFIVIQPAYGDTLKQRTVVHLAYDAENLYFAFRCYDDRPDKIKATIAQRDRTMGDDWAGVVLDALGNRQSAYIFLCNPYGIQTDILQTPDSGDPAPDWVWQSAGRLLEDGYSIEIAVPLRSIRYNDGGRSTMYLVFGRYLSRTGETALFPSVGPGQSLFVQALPAVYENLRPPQRLELLPSFTYSSRAELTSPRHWGNAESTPSFGVGGKLALTSAVTAEATYNPDFSQVESDAFQMEVNQRYPIFYEEKRPFFMEASSLFNVAATGEDNMMATAVHTRRIIDPNWGGRITGTIGRAAFGLLAAEDAAPGRSFDDEENPHWGKTARFAVARWKYTFHGDSYGGLIYSGREFDQGYNRVVGGDFQYRLKDRHTFSATVLQAASQDADDLSRQKGKALMFNYGYMTKKLGIWSALEQYDPGFAMETAFYRRTGFQRAVFYLGPNFYPNEKKQPWLRRVNPFLFGYVLHDLETKQDDRLLVAALRTMWTRQGMIRLDYISMQEYWKIRSFDQRIGRVQASFQATTKLNFYARLSQGRRIYYDEENPYLGRFSSGYLELTLQPTSKLTQSFDYYHETFRRPQHGALEYDLDIINSRTTYQFNKYFFLRAIFRYQDFDKKLLTDFLASFTFIPGTVLHVGYGSLYERKEWMNNEWVDDRGAYRESTRSFFLKASYLWRM